jgi:thermostable 8-oxoguanine DNA glycosylase
MDLAEVQRKFIYSVIVAGKSAEFARNKLGSWLETYNFDNELPFDTIKRLRGNNKLRDSFEDVKTGNYTKLTRACKEVIDSGIDITNSDPDQLEQIYGVGPKTSRFFIMWTRDGEEYGILDTHILKWLQEQGYDVPDDTPQDLDRYEEIQEVFINEAKKRNLKPRDLDFKIWKNRASDGYSVKDEVDIN